MFHFIQDDLVLSQVEVNRELSPGGLEFESKGDESMGSIFLERLG